MTLRSRGGLRPFDPKANKTVIYVARDAFLSIGYTGAAYLNNRPTDQWIAEKLLGREVGSRTRVQGTGAIPQRLTTGPTGPWYDAGSAIRVLREGLIATRGLRTVERHNFPRLIVAGWQRWKRHSRPVAYVIADDGVGHLYSRLTATPRHDWLRGRFHLNFTPINSQLANIRSELTEQLKNSSPTADELEQRMAQALRRAADRGTTFPGTLEYIALRGLAADLCDQYPWIRSPTTLPLTFVPRPGDTVAGDGKVLP